jgi:hypothetical protein
MAFPVVEFSREGYRQLITISETIGSKLIIGFLSVAIHNESNP